ncbi:beta-1,3-galactosyltransferase 2-like [Cheilinus undulatus]|uniref:beta-1,3-galactosyltransferase 2-like n=1 Tax=Cheilinus undulatus TaxID=241271 RepID=UPI001BD5E6EA|nr:beta-1,3-galactosyltransferase 2-like [Cheilinus undulatus]
MSREFGLGLLLLPCPTLALLSLVWVDTSNSGLAALMDDTPKGDWPLEIGVLLFLVQQANQPTVREGLEFRHIPKLFWGDKLNTTKTKLNVSHQIPETRLAISPQTTIANISTQKEAAQSPQEVPDVKTTMAVTVEGEHGDNITPGPYAYIINEPEKCSQSRQAPFLVLLITTEARQEEARNAIRQTWGNESLAPGFIRLFLLGKNGGVLQQKMLEAESNRHHDIIQQDFSDTYNNLTIKILMGLNWVALHCPQVSYVMKTDSDMFVNTEYLIHSVLRPKIKPKTDYFTGHILENQTPFRDRNNKWYMPPELYPGNRYPTFCSGTGYVFSGDLATKLYQASLNIPHIHLEDVYVGLCLAKLGVKPTPPPSPVLFHNWRVSYSSCRYSHLVTSHGFRPDEILKYWRLLQSTKHNACFDKMRSRAVSLSRFSVNLLSAYSEMRENEFSVSEGGISN